MFLLLQKIPIYKSLSQTNRRQNGRSEPIGIRQNEGARKITFFSRRLWSVREIKGKQGIGTNPHTRQASMTVEAALGLTFFLLLIVSVCQLFLVMELQLHMQRALEQVGNEAAGYSYVSSQIPMWESESQLIGRIEEYLLTELSEEALRLRLVSILDGDGLARSLVEGGAGGVSLEGSSLRNNNHRIRLALSYRVRLPVSVLGFASIELHQQSYRYAWLGDAEPETTQGQDGQEEPMVYVTQNSQVYHLTPSCTHLRLSVREVAPGSIDALRNENGAKYYACELCHPNGTEAVLYITGDGNRYHGSRECGGIRRNVTAIPLSQAEGLRPCSRCGQAGNP